MPSDRPQRSSDGAPRVRLSPRLYLVEAEIDAPSSAPAFNRWYDEVHVPALLGVDGIGRARRYEQRGAPARFLATYEIDGPQVFEDPAYARATGWGEMRGVVRDWAAGVYELAHVRAGASA